MAAAMVVVLWIADAIAQTSAAGSEAAAHAGTPLGRHGGAASSPLEAMVARARWAYLDALVSVIPLATALREARRRRGWTQLDLAVRLGTARATVSRWERGRSLPRYRHLRALTPLLDLAPGELTRPERSARRPASRRLQSVAERIARALAELPGWRVPTRWGAPGAPHAP